MWFRSRWGSVPKINIDSMMLHVNLPQHVAFFGLQRELSHSSGWKQDTNASLVIELYSRRRQGQTFLVLQGGTGLHRNIDKPLISGTSRFVVKEWPRRCSKGELAVTPQKWLFWGPIHPWRHTGSNPSIGGSLGILRVVCFTSFTSGFEITLPKNLTIRSKTWCLKRKMDFPWIEQVRKSGSTCDFCWEIYVGVSKNMGIPKWMVYKGKPY